MLESLGLDGMVPHGYCLLWLPGLVALHVASDALIALSYFSIPFALLYFVRRRQDLAFKWIFGLYAAFILSCGLTHLLGIWTLWQPAYWLDGGVKAVTAVASVGTAALTWLLVPRALALPSPAALQQANRQLHQEVLQRQRAEEALREVNASLEQRVAERTAEVHAANVHLQGANAELRQALGDKETLIKEVHHRVKNNLQMLCSLLELQGEAIESAEGKAALELSTTRIYAIARLYEQLYRSMSSGQVMLCEYLAGLAKTFAQTYSGSGIVFHVPENQGIYLDMDRAIPCGLILNELFTNAAKHAFPPGTAGEVGAEVRTLGDRIQIRIWDNGRGLPEGLDIQQSTSLGLRLVRILAQRLKAEIRVESYEGAAFTLTFPSAPEE
ncbi:MAG: sensor histidine kinase [Candidatus Methylomirabilales bacterium]